MDLEEYLSILEPDETMRDLLQRLNSDPVKTGIPFIDGMLTLRPGNVVEIAGTVGSGKTELLLQAAITCIVPPEYGGLGAPCFLIDVDGRLDAVRFTIALGQRLRRKEVMLGQDRELAESLRRCKICRCDSSAQYLALLKTLGPLLRDCRAKGQPARMMLIDGVDAFYYCDRVHKDAGPGVASPSPMSMQRTHAAAAAAVKRLAREYRLLVLATQTVSVILPKAPRGGAGLGPAAEADDEDGAGAPAAAAVVLEMREKMAPAWRGIVTHQLFLRKRDPADSGLVRETVGGEDRTETPVLAQWRKGPGAVLMQGAMEIVIPLGGRGENGPAPGTGVRRA